MKRTLILATAAALAVAGSASAANLLANGGFETGWSGTSGYYNIGTQPGSNSQGPDHGVPSGFGWTVGNGNVDIISYNTYGPGPTNGGAYGLDLVGYGSTGEISQSITTSATQKYVVTFDYKSNPGVSGPTAAVLFNGINIGNVTGSGAWQVFTTTVTGTGGSALFALNETYGYSNGGVFLDNISVSAVPEPAAWALMIGGLGMTGFALRRRAAKALAV
jgi:hypothetical protein